MFDGEDEDDKEVCLIDWIKLDMIIKLSLLSSKKDEFVGQLFLINKTRNCLLIKFYLLINDKNLIINRSKAC